MRTAGAIAVGLLLGFAPPASGQYDLVPDLDDPRTPVEARRWLDATLGELESGRTVLVETPGGPLPYVVLDRSDLTEARESASLTDASPRGILLWSANVLREQGALRSRLASTRERAFAEGAVPPTEPAPRPTPTPRLAVIGGTPDSDPTPEAPPDRSSGNEAAPARADFAEGGSTDEPAPTSADPDATPTDPGPSPDLDPPAPPVELAPGTAATSSPPAVPSQPVTGGGGGGVRGGRSSGVGVWAIVGLGLLAATLGVALLVARRRPDRAARPVAPSAIPSAAPRIDLTLDVSGPSGDRTVGFRSAPILVGRASDSDLVLDDPRVSRRHARILVEEGALWIEDLGSSTGMDIDGRIADRAPLRRSSTIRLGDTTVTVR